MCADERRTLRSNSVTLFSHMTIGVSVFVKCDTIFILFLFEITIISDFYVSQGSAATY